MIIIISLMIIIVVIIMSLSSLCHRPLTKGQWCRVFLQVRRSLAYFWNKNTFNWNQLLPWWSTVVNATFRIPSTMGAWPKMPVTMPNRGGVFGFVFGLGWTGLGWSWAGLGDRVEDTVEDTSEDTCELRRYMLSLFLLVNLTMCIAAVFCTIQNWHKWLFKGRNVLNWG